MAHHLSTLLPAGLGLLTALASPAMGGSFALRASHSDTAGPTGGPVRRGATLLPQPVWPDATVPFVLEGFPDQAAEKIRDSMRIWEQETCVRFVPKQDRHKTWARYTKRDSGCYAHHGYPGDNFGETIVNLDQPNIGQQVITLGLYESCSAGGVPVSQIGHLLGLINEQQRSDRENFVHVVIHNVKKSGKGQMVAQPHTDNTQPYDYNSVMHGSTHAFAKDKGARVTIWTRDKKKPIKPSPIPTLSDYRAVNRAYNCANSTKLYMPECVSSAPPANGKDTTSFSFIVDQHTVAWMRQNGFDAFSLSRSCGPTREGEAETGSVKLGDSPGGDGHPFVVDGLPRCRVGHVTRYHLYMCKGNGDGIGTGKGKGNGFCAYCRGNEGGRKVCPLDGQKQTNLAAAAVTDTKLWICHRL